MGNQHGNFLAVIDVGSARPAHWWRKLRDNGLRYRGWCRRSRGTRKGVIVDLRRPVSSIQKSGEAAEDVAVRRLSTRW